MCHLNHPPTPHNNSIYDGNMYLYFTYHLLIQPEYFPIFSTNSSYQLYVQLEKLHVVEVVYQLVKYNHLEGRLSIGLFFP